LIVVWKTRNQNPSPDGEHARLPPRASIRHPPVHRLIRPQRGRRRALQRLFDRRLVRFVERLAAPPGCYAAHFRWIDGGLIVEGLTPIGRATVLALKLNMAAHVTSRRFWISAGVHPPPDGPKPVLILPTLTNEHLYTITASSRSRCAMTGPHARQATCLACALWPRTRPLVTSFRRCHRMSQNVTLEKDSTPCPGLGPERPPLQGSPNHAGGFVAEVARRRQTSDGR
jgi:hypothetical protein